MSTTTSPARTHPSSSRATRSIAAGSSRSASGCRAWPICAIASKRCATSSASVPAPSRRRDDWRAAARRHPRDEGRAAASGAAARRFL
jgi:hypothetical protein